MSTTMLNPPTISDAEPHAEAPGIGPPTMHFDRRHHERHEASGHVTMLRRSHTTQAHRQPICSIQLRDMSNGGLAAVADMPLEQDELVAVLFPPHGSDRGMDLMGHVVRCLPGDEEAGGYSIGIAFDHLAAA